MGISAAVRKAKHAQASIAFYHANKERICARRRVLRKRPGALRKYRKYQLAWSRANKVKIYHYGKVNRARLKDQVFTAYGGWVCACCQEREPIFLTLDHIHNNGAEERRKTGEATYRLFARLRREGFPTGYQVLCFNCNCGKRDNGGICPHLTKPR